MPHGRGAGRWVLGGPAAPPLRGAGPGDGPQGGGRAGPGPRTRGGNGAGLCAGPSARAGARSFRGAAAQHQLPGEPSSPFSELGACHEYVGRIEGG